MKSSLAGVLAVLAVVGLIWPTSAQTVGYLCQNTEVYVLEEGLDRTVVEVRFDVGERAPSTTALNFALALPSNQAPQVRVIEVDEEVLDTPIEVTSFTVFTLGAPARARDQWLVQVSASPLRAAPDGSTFSVKRIVAEFIHPAPVEVARSVEEEQRFSRGLRPAQLLDHAVAPAVLNPHMAALLETAALSRRAPVFVEDTFLRSPRWLRIEVEEDGWVRLDYPTLRSALGADVDLVELDSVRLFGAHRRFEPEMPSDFDSSWTPERHLRERPLYIEGAGSTLTPGDHVLAYLPGPRGWVDRVRQADRWLDHEEHPYADRVAYWLTWDEVGGVDDGEFNVAPLRVGSLDGSVGSATRSASTGIARRHFEENLLPAFGYPPDDWLWRDLIDPGSSVSFPFEIEDLVVGGVSRIYTEPGAQDVSNRLRIVQVTAQFELNDVVVGSRTWLRSDRFREDDGVIKFEATDVPLQEGSNRFRMRHVPVSETTPGNALVYFDMFSIAYEKSLRWRDEPLVWSVTDDLATSERWRFEVDAVGNSFDAPLVFDVTDGWSPLRVQGASVTDGGARLEFEADLAATSAREFVVATASEIAPPVSVRRHRPRLLRGEVTDGGGVSGAGWDMVIIYGEGMESPAERLATFRRGNLPGVGSPRVTAVDAQDVYDVFGHGTKDPAAIRNYLRFLFEVDRRLLYVCFLGDANRDARGVLPNAAPDPLPTFIQDYFPRNTDNGLSLISFASDDWLVSLHDPVPRSSSFLLDLPDVASGRLPARNRSEADLLVQRVIDYEQNPPSGSWRNLMLLAADDEVGAGAQNYREDFHIAQAECVSEVVLPKGMDVDKLYLTEFPIPPGDLGKPAARVAMRDRWNDGRLIVHYIGHGAPEQLADEVLFRIEDVSSLRNGPNLPLFLAFSCDVSIFDDGAKRSMTEVLVTQPTGGAIATIAATQVSYVTQNNDLTESFYAQLYPNAEFPGRPGDRVDRSTPLGLALIRSKWSIPQTQNTSHRDNDAKYVLLGDPALRLQSPRESLELEGSLVQAIRSGRELDVSAQLPEGISGGGTWYLDAKESTDSVTYVMNGGASTIPPRDLPYVLSGGSFYRGQGSFSDGRFEAQLRAPAVMRFGNTGRVRVIMESGHEQFMAVIDSLDVIRDALDSDDRESPKIALQFDGNARQVQPGTLLRATIEDPSGINVLGNAPASSILLTDDESGISLDLTERFVLEEGTYTRGSVEVALPEDTSPGSQSRTLSVSDMLGNSGTATIEFEVVAAGETGLGAHAPIPNPFTDATQFAVEVLSPEGLGATVTVDIHALDGAHLRRLRTQSVQNGRLTLPWDGTDRRGDDVANGTYLYVLRVEFATDPVRVFTDTGRVVRMR